MCWRASWTIPIPTWGRPMPDLGPYRLTEKEAAAEAARRWGGNAFAIKAHEKDRNMRYVVGLLVRGKHTHDLYRLPISWGGCYEAALGLAPEHPGGIDLSTPCVIFTDGTVEYTDGRKAKFEGAMLQLGAAEPITGGKP